MKSEIKNLELAADRKTLPGVSITINHLTKSFGGKDVLHDLDLNVQPGEFVTIVGKSGCGKSTLLRLLAGLEQPTSGEIFLDGEASTSAKVQEGVRVMFQDPRLLPWRTVIQNVSIGLEGDKKEISQRAQDVLAHVGLADRANEWPSKLSGGQRQRVALARALIHKPKLLLLDEPLGALDALTRLEMQRLIERLWLEHKFTALLVTHDVSEAVCLGDRAILLENGKITIDETIALERPRDHTEHQVAQIEKRVLNRLMTVQAINTRNQIEGVISHISLGPVLSEVHVQTSAGAVVSTVLTRSLSEQPLEIGALVLANFKSTEVMLAT